MSAAVRDRSQAKIRVTPPRGRQASGVPGSGRLGKMATLGGGGLSPTVSILAASLLAILILVVVLATGHRGERIVASLWNRIAWAVAPAGLKVVSVQVKGASPVAVSDIVSASGLKPGLPILAVDLDQVRENLLQVGWVEDASVIRLLPNSIVLSVRERRRLAVWQSHGRTVVLDADGQIVKEADPAKFPELPLIVGEGADSAAADILGEVAQRAKLKGRVEALVRVDGRRWDLRLKDGCIIQLPSTDEGAALIRLDQLDERQRILDLGFERIDLRVPDMISVRPRGSGVPAQIQPVAGGV